jgi:hypothetical protein
LINRIITEKVLLIADDIRARHCRKFIRLHKTQQPPGPLDNSRTVINLSEVSLEEVACSALRGPKLRRGSGRIPVKDFLYGVEKAIGTLPEETTQEI